MAFQWVSCFECLTCGELGRADAVDYDALGYPTCPACGERSGPLAGRAAASDGGESDFEFGVSAEGDPRPEDERRAESHT
jgi:hypothetical protein